jgi:hypothetical protein
MRPEGSKRTMPKYLIRMKHSPDQCPSANSKVRDLMLKRSPDLKHLAQKLGVQFLAGPFSIVAEHEGFAVVEADRVETVNDFVSQSDLNQWNTIRVSQILNTFDSLQYLAKHPSSLY